MKNEVVLAFITFFAVLFFFKDIDPNPEEEMDEIEPEAKEQLSLGEQLRVFFSETKKALS